MNHAQGEDPFSNPVLDSQIKSAISNLHFFLAWVLFTSVYNVLIYYFYFKDFSAAYNIWVILFGTVIIIALIISVTLSKSSKITILNQDMWAQLVCLTTGTGLAIGIYTIIKIVPEENSLVQDIHLLTLTGLMLSIIYIFAIIFLSQRFRYFLLIFIPSALCTVFLDLFFLHNKYQILNLVFYISTSFISRNMPMNCRKS